MKKKAISVLLVLVMAVYLFSVSAFAATNNYVIHKYLDRAVLTTSYSTRGHYFPANNSIATLTRDLYSDDTHADVSLYDYEAKYRDESVTLPVSYLYFYPDSTRAIRLISF